MLELTIDHVRSWVIPARCPPGVMVLLLLAIATVAQGPTTGRIEGVVKGPNGAVIPGATITIINRATGDVRTSTTNDDGHYLAQFLRPGNYRVQVEMIGFPRATFDVPVVITQTTRLDMELKLRLEPVSVPVNGSVQTDGPHLGRPLDSRFITELPLPSRNYTQILSLSPGVATYLPDSTAVGRNNQIISVNGARMTQNNVQINGVDSNTLGTRSAVNIPVPAPETIQEFKVQTSLYDATFGRSGGGNVQVVTRSGGNDFHGTGYEYFRNDALNANNPFLKAARIPRPVLKRNSFGGTFGGPLKRDKAFFFLSYQGTRERNGASLLNSVSASVLVAQGLTDDRSEQTLLKTFAPRLPGGQPAPSINPVALNLLNARLPNGKFVIPTPQANGRYSGSDISTFREDQFNANLDFRLSEHNWLAGKVFFSNTPSFFSLPSFRGTGPNVPGYGTNEANNTRVFAVQDVHSFSPKLFNELRLGLTMHRNYISLPQPLRDTALGISRSNADVYPGLGLIRIAQAAGGVIVGTQTNINPAFGWVSTLADILSVTHGRQLIRLGGEFRFNEVDFAQQQFTRGQIDFQSFNDFLIGNSSSSTLGDGVGNRKQRALDYNFFLQDDWKARPNLTINLGLRYELDLPLYENRGLIATFDPNLYRPPRAGSTTPTAGFVQAGNVTPAYDLPEVPNVSKYVIHSKDLNNFAPRIGFAYLWHKAHEVVVRGGYGLFYSRPTFQYISSSVSGPPTYVLARRQNAPFADPFFPIPARGQFPTFVEGVLLAGTALDRRMRIPYFHQFNVSAQTELPGKMLLELALVGTRGVNLFRQVAINQSRLAGPLRPIINDVTGAVITTNTPLADNVRARAPFQGVEVAGFFQNQANAQSSYNSLQISLTRRLTQGLQVLASYTFAKSLDTNSGAGGGPGIVGIVNPGAVGDTGTILGDQGNNRANRGLSDFDRTHRFVFSYIWDLPQHFADHSARVMRGLLANWQIGGIVVTMSGLPIDIVDANAASFYLGQNNGLSRPNWAAGATRQTATTNIPKGYFLNPRAFARPFVPTGAIIPSSGGTAISGTVPAGAAFGTDFGNVGRNVLRGPSQTNIDLNVIKRFPLGETKLLELHAEFFNLFNHVNFANPISDLNAVPAGGLNSNTGEIINPGDFGRIISTSNNPRVIQLAVKLNF